MKSFSFLLFFLILFSCGNKRLLELPETKNAAITEIHDVSHAYLFYDESLTDKVDLNRKNLISTTNWLINVDKRLTLEQAIPQITFLQNKKRDAKMHKNDAAKNYFTCHDTSIQSLGFLEFTNIVYNTTSIRDYFKYRERQERLGIILNVQSPNSFGLEFKTLAETSTEIFDDLNLAANALQEQIERQSDHKLYLLFSFQITFQDYIEIKSLVAKLESTGLKVDNNEFIY